MSLILESSCEHKISKKLSSPKALCSKWQPEAAECVLVIRIELWILTKARTHNTVFAMHKTVNVKGMGHAVVTPCSSSHQQFSG